MGQTRGLELRASWSGCAGEGRTFKWGGSLRGWAPWLAPCCHLYLRAPHRILPPPPPAVVTAYFGVLHSGRVRSCLQQSEPRQCLPRPLRHWRRHHLHSAPGSHLLSPYPLGIWASAAAGPGPSPAFWVWSCYFSSGTLSHSVRARGLDSPPFPGGATPYQPLCPVGWHPGSCSLPAFTCLLSKFHLSLWPLNQRVAPGVRTLFLSLGTPGSEPRALDGGASADAHF